MEDKISEEGLSKSQADRIKGLFVKHKAWFRTTYECLEFREPIMFLERRSGDVEFYENVTVGKFEFTHSDGNPRFIIINPKNIKKFGFASKSFRGYYCHEDFPLPLPEDPLITSEQFNITIEKSLNDINKWRAQELAAKGEMFWKIAASIALILGVIGVIIIAIPKNPTIIETVKTVVQNASNVPVPLLP